MCNRPRMPNQTTFKLEFKRNGMENNLGGHTLRITDEKSVEIDEDHDFCSKVLPDHTKIVEIEIDPSSLAPDVKIIGVTVFIHNPTTVCVKLSNGDVKYVTKK